MAVKDVFIVTDRGIIDMKKDMKLVYIFGLTIISLIFIIGLSRAGDVSVYDTDDFEIMHGTNYNNEIQMEDQGHIVSGTVDTDGHIFMYNYKTGCYIDGDVDESGRGRVYDYGTGQYYDIIVE